MSVLFFSIFLFLKRIKKEKKEAAAMVNVAEQAEPAKGRIVTIRGRRSDELEGHRIVSDARAEKFPSASWRAKPANFHDFESLKQKMGETRNEKRKLIIETRQLARRLTDSKDAVSRIMEKKRMLTNSKNLKDLVAVDLGVGTAAGKDGWLAVPEPPPNDEIAKQLRALELKLINREMVKSMRGVEDLAAREEEACEEVEKRLKRRRDKLSSFPTRVVQSKEDVQREAIRLIDEKGELEQKRDTLKRDYSAKLAEARSAALKMRDVVADSSEELTALRDDLKYWKQRLKLENVKMEPVRVEVERLKGELDALGKVMGIGNWQAVLVKSAFLIGCNMDINKAGVLEGPSGAPATRYSDVVDKIFCGRVPHVAKFHLWPQISASMDDIKEACQEQDIFFEDGKIEHTRLGEDEFYRIIKFLRNKSNDAAREL